MKKLLNRFLPSIIKRILIKQKYKKYNLSVHKSNIQEDKLVKIECDNRERDDFLQTILKKTFGEVLSVEEYSLYFHPIAIIEKPKNIEEYLKLIGAKSRNMNKKAKKNGIYCELFDWNDRLEEIYQINISAPYRQGKEMDSSYHEYPKKIAYLDEKDFKITYIGAFKENLLIGYIELYIYGNFIMTNRILGHKEHLKYGIMNLMIKKSVELIIEEDITYLNYLTMQNRENNSLSSFKKRVGFREYSLLELT